MFGSGLLKGLGITLQHLWESFTDDRKETPSRYENSTDLGGDRRVMRQPVTQEGLLTLQYPEEKRLLPERFRYIPMLLFDTETGEDRCTACGICAKVCPPQCIWIVRDADENGKPVTRPAEFYIDTAVCMSCSFCAEFCPFDAIKMNHDHELAVYDRYPQLVYNKAELTVPLEYYAALWPTQFAEEQVRIKAEREAERAKAEAKARADAEKKAAAAKAAAPAGDGAAKPQRSPAELEAMKRQAQERAAAAKARAAGGAEASAEPAASAAGPTAPAAAPGEAPPDAEAARKARIEELKRKAQEAAAKRKQGD